MPHAEPVIIGLYLLVLAAVSLGLSRGRHVAADYLAGRHDMPTWAICLSIVATETSTLTIVSVPGVAYGGGMVFVGLGLGYLVGRIAVARILLPLYMRGGPGGSLASAYQYLGHRFGRDMQRLAAGAFLLTRLLAEGVRLFASTLPICALLAAAHLPAGRMPVLIGLTALTALYTAIGGLRAVVWSDSIQFGVYAAGAAFCVALLLPRDAAGSLDMTSLHAAWLAGRFALFQRGGAILTSPYAPVTAIVGGAIMSMASHGTDQLMVQRVLAARSLRAAQAAMIGSAIVVTLLFGLLSAVGVLLWLRHGGASPAALGLPSPDALFPAFIARDLPPALAGLLIAGIVSATMGSLASALNAMTASTLSDLLPTRLTRRSGAVALSRAITAAWAVMLVVTASCFSATGQSVVIFGLSIAGYSYGALLGAFLLGLLVRGARQRDAVAAFLGTLAIMTALILGVHPGGHAIAFPWLVPIGVAASLAIGGACRLRPDPIPTDQPTERPTP
ncbi:Na+/solute symporter [Gluconacetobacter diazotrophicus PA1 5]|uniref:Putative sodium cotransporter n=1 Tax=Gluconacetobacter diazotrophicus (strain ATCC 49037 / DSM 5601 / CCUG 37298 / CIP 103539 / LMG 7603 / PAl5) TaxID=272568 RepID=A9HDG8_GLUDA|nr:sodium:solute symporter [Gluconacetobacter diazotrophicus]ACI51629.1 Na+/solute symporter [Gluconacetobacter diazotrophicus PA1 5]TWB02828.1 Na+/proline symporter [Gluconacetobacter diazotrophicus]CAP55099.1 putative sodium cotransporter [Gluconacetobacter diazotrophicus PA1 5]